MPAPTDTSPAVATQSLTKRYGTNEALRAVSLTVERGEIFALLGPNGAGKTTLFSILATLRSPSDGTARVLGHDVVSDRNAIRNRIGIVFQEPAIEQRLTGRENLQMMGLFYGLSRGDARQRAQELIGELNLADGADRAARTLSGGQRRRLELARALVTRPQLLFLDEATLGIDIDARRTFWEHIRAFADGGGTVFLTTHYMEEAEVAHRIAFIDRGQIVCVDTPAALKSQLGGVVRLWTDDPARTGEWLAAHDYTAATAGAENTVSHQDPASIMPRILQELPTKVLRVEMHPATLDDVFRRATGRSLGQEIGGPPAGPRPGGPKP